jgi:hypothetical protein
MLLVPLFDLTISAVYQVKKTSEDWEDCNKHFHVIFDYCEMLSQVATGVVCNIFMLRNMSVAVLLTCPDEKEEKKKRKVLTFTTWVFLVLYIMTYTAITCLEKKIMEPGHPHQQIFVPLYIFSNLFKLLMTTVLGVVTIVFAGKLKELIA